ncbi:hypothetical protein AB4225_14605 [Streptomyces sp. 2RAF24]|uniref:hypothetical protein n=1 Tax=Streptomyces sp. 2RAF24 TaxID=3232997 RepID=UPI003F9C1A75
MPELPPSTGFARPRPSRFALVFQLLLALGLVAASRWFHGRDLLGSELALWWLSLLLGVSVFLAVFGRGVTRRDGTGSGNAALTRTRSGSNGWAWLMLTAVLVPVAVVADRPWNAPWWPGRHEASRLPDPCLAGAAAASRLTPHARGDGDRPPNAGYGPGARCVWRDTENGATLWVEYGLAEWKGSLGGSATDAARKQQALNGRVVEEEGSRTAPVAGLGDEASSVSVPGREAAVLVRVANVTVSVRYLLPPTTGPDPARDDAAARSAAEQAAREAVGPIRLD